MSRTVLTLNSGSSSLKFGLHRVAGGAVQTLLTDSIAAADAQQALAAIGAQIGIRLREAALPAIEGIGHRIVHGGTALRRHCRIDAVVRRELEAAAVLAPLHGAAALALIDRAGAVYPQLPQFACVDSAFHLTMPEVARVLPIDRTLCREGLERYGFHGLSCASVVHRLRASRPSRLPERLVIAHLGHGASITAVRAGESVDTSMGLTPTGGILMGTRSGDIDPGVVLALLRGAHYDAAQLAMLFDQRSGLLGVSGISSDMQTLRRVAEGGGKGGADAQLAIAMFCQSAKKQIGAMAAVLGGLDLLVFTGGIGEHDAASRATICEGLHGLWLLRAGSAPVVEVMPAGEDQQMARHLAELMP